MYAKLCAAVAIMICLAGAASAETVNYVTYEVTNVTFNANYDGLTELWTYDEILQIWLTQPTTSVMYFDVVITGVVGSADTYFRSAIMDMTVSITGAGSEHLTANPLYNQYAVVTTMPPDATGLTDVALIASNWRWGLNSTQVNSSANGDDEPTDASAIMSYQVATASGSDAILILGSSIVARVFYVWDGTAINFDDLTVTFSALSDQFGGATFMRNKDSDTYFVFIPEPATMGLLGLGLVGLVARRRSKK